MKKQMKKIGLGLLVGSMVVSTNVFAEASNMEQKLLETKASEVSPRITVGKYVQITRRYPSVGSIPDLYFYSYYDHDYNVTLKGHLEVMTVSEVSTGYDVIFYGYVCGTI